ncbi:response regulator [Candidatus Peregrinibacteria bacterium]|nr:response regulator [Candidatus Peregrinibacteria bacterium]
MNTNCKEAGILLVEDNANDVEFTLRALEKHALANKVYVTKDGEEALEFIFATGRYAQRCTSPFPKVILLDLKLPKVNGLEVLKKMKADERTRIIPVVVVTSSREDSDLKESYKLGVNSYIMKPIEFDDFSNALSQVGLYWMVINKLPPQ